MRLKKSVYNTIFYLLQQIVVAIYGLVVPALIIKTYGSSVNGVVSSISQFLSYITLLESGVGGVIVAALYKPLAQKDTKKISGIIFATEDFFKKLSYIFIIYIIFLSIIYPYFVRNEYGFFYTFSLVIIISISSLAQYYFGMTYQILLQSDQRGWIISFVQILSTVISLFINILCVKFHTSIHILKLICTIVYVLRPLLLKTYVHHHYKIDKTVPLDKESLSQRWDGLAHHIAYIIHYNTDITVLTVFTNVLEVSVYSVYYNIVANIYKVISSVKSGIKDSVGNMIACEEWDLLRKILDEFETLNFMLINIFYSCVLILILPFINIYTQGVTDINYIRPTFAIILVLSEAVYGLREPYDMVIYAASHFKQTKKGAYIEALINLGSSLIFVNYWGIEGVAVGTLLAMIYRLLQYVLYLKRNIIHRGTEIFWKKFISNLILGCINYLIFSNIIVKIDTYLTWFIYAIIVFVSIAVINIVFNYIFYNDSIRGILSHFVKKH